MKNSKPKTEAEYNKRQEFKNLVKDIKLGKYKKKPPKAPKGTFVDPDSVTKKELVRIDDWAIKIMQKHEHLFSNDIPPGKIFIKEALKPEDVDIPQIYDFTDLHYQIYRTHKGEFAIRIMQGNRTIVTAAYAKI